MVDVIGDNMSARRQDELKTGVGLEMAGQLTNNPGLSPHGYKRVGGIRQETVTIDEYEHGCETPVAARSGRHLRSHAAFAT